MDDICVLHSITIFLSFTGECYKIPELSSYKCIFVSLISVKKMQSKKKSTRAYSIIRASLWLFPSGRIFLLCLAEDFLPLRTRSDTTSTWKWIGFLVNPRVSHKSKAEPQRFPSCNIMPSCQLSPPKRPKYFRRFSAEETQRHGKTHGDPWKHSPSSFLKVRHKWPDCGEARSWNKMEMETMEFCALEQVINCSQL